MNKAKYVIENSKDGQFYFTLRAKNGKTILTSEMYKTKQGAEVGIASVQVNASCENIVDKTSKKKQ